MKKLTDCCELGEWVEGRGWGGKVTHELLLVICRKGREGGIKHFGNEFG